MCLKGHRIHQGLALIFTDKHPCPCLRFLKRIAQPVVIAVVDHVLIPVIILNLFPDARLLLCCQLARIQFIPKTARHCHHAAGFHGNPPSGLVVGTCGYMGTNG